MKISLKTLSGIIFLIVSVYPVIEALIHWNDGDNSEMKKLFNEHSHKVPSSQYTTDTNQQITSVIDTIADRETLDNLKTFRSTSTGTVLLFSIKNDTAHRYKLYHSLYRQKWGLKRKKSSNEKCRDYILDELEEKAIEGIINDQHLNIKLSNKIKARVRYYCKNRRVKAIAIALDAAGATITSIQDQPSLK